MKPPIKKVPTISYVLEQVKTTIQTLTNHEKRTMVLNWLLHYCQYLIFESRFDPTRLKKYNPGDIIDVNFGLNVAHEFAGQHFAVVLEDDNSRKSSSVFVVPLSSYSDPSEIRSSEIDLGFIPKLNEYRNNPDARGTRAVVNQMRSVDKIRVYYPKKRNESLGSLDPQKFHLLQDNVRKNYFKCRMGEVENSLRCFICESKLELTTSSNKGSGYYISLECSNEECGTSYPLLHTKSLRDINYM